MKRITVSVMVGLVALAASADASAKSVRLADIPQVELSDTGDLGELPRRVREGARVDGLFLVHPPKKQQNGTPMAFIAPTKASAREFAREGWTNLEEEQSKACLTVLPPHAVEFRPSKEYPAEMTFHQNVWAESKNRGRVSVVRSERLVRNGDEATLEVTLAFVDAVSLGVQLIERQSVPLHRIASGPKELDVFAARDGDRVQFVVTSSAIENQDLRRRFQSLRMTAASDQGWSDCGFIRTTMDADSGGRAATVFAPVVLSVEDSERRFPGTPADAPATPVQRLNFREAAVHLSVSRTSSDRQPVVSVAFGWEGDADHFEM